MTRSIILTSLLALSCAPAPIHHVAAPTTLPGDPPDERAPEASTSGELEMRAARTGERAEAATRDEDGRIVRYVLESGFDGDRRVAGPGERLELGAYYVLEPIPEHVTVHRRQAQPAIWEVRHRDRRVALLKMESWPVAARPGGIPFHDEGPIPREVELDEWGPREDVTIRLRRWTSERHVFYLEAFPRADRWIRGRLRELALPEEIREPEGPTITTVPREGEAPTR